MGSLNFLAAGAFKHSHCLLKLYRSICKKGFALNICVRKALKMETDQGLENRKAAVKNMQNKVLRASSWEIMSSIALETSRKVRMELNLLKISKLFGFISP